MGFRPLPPQSPRDIGRSRAGPHIRFGKRRGDRFAISCHLLQLLGWDLLSLFAASLQAAFTDSAGS